MTPGERERFRNLLLVAKESPFAGERRNALVAAERMAQRRGLTLEEAAHGSPPETASRKEPLRRDSEVRSSDERARYEEALQAAYARGLDSNEKRREKTWNMHYMRPNPRRRSPLAHARILLTETRLPLPEIASISGLDIWRVAGLKLKLRVKPS